MPSVTMIGEALCNGPKEFWGAETYQVTVADEAGLTLFMVCMMAVISPAWFMRKIWGWPSGDAKHRHVH